MRSGGIEICLRRVVPEGEMALPEPEISAEDAPKVLQTIHQWTLAWEREGGDNAGDSYR
jgi:hypothetical protein